MEVSEADHVLDALHRGRVHRLDPPLGREPHLVSVVVDHLDLPPFGGYDPGPDGHVEFAAGYRLHPYVVALRSKHIG